MGDIKVYKIRDMEGGDAIDLIERHESWVPGGVASDLYGALKAMVDRYAPRYHDCTDDGMPECEICEARASLVRAEGE